MSGEIQCLNPKEVIHGYAPVNDDVLMHYVEIGSGRNGVAICCHGWPEAGYSWRAIMPRLAELGIRAIALDLRGFGLTKLPSEDLPDSFFSLENVCKDISTFIEYLKIEKCMMIGHDWGGAVVWSFATHYREKVSAVISLNTPYFPVNPEKDPSIAFDKMVKLARKELDIALKKKNNNNNISEEDIIFLEKYKPILRNRFNYQAYFAFDEAVEELNRNVKYSLSCIFRGGNPADKLKVKNVSTSNVTERGGFLVGFPENVPTSVMFTEEEFDHFVEVFKYNGFGPGLKWYRNVKNNYLYNKQVKDPFIMIPCLMITAGKDKVLTPDMTNHMKDFIPKLSTEHIPESSHWSPIDCKKEVVDIITNWFIRYHSEILLPFNYYVQRSKL
eukprot:TRINITY_DN16012_c0_g1_i1.p1 TRINITY_DN16012_c0_g1~~TRINITY_DN16012_c0_g1_i1.p1  ORF type:complete len:386 (-),score=99.88 TRINITY_DN16012_c0_g1_i1:121-1278(-)